jgi:hypothetical protein
MMRLAALVLAAILTSAVAFAQAGRASPVQHVPAPDGSAGKPASADLPVSLGKIREALETSPAELLRGLDERPHFRLEVRERRSIEDLLATIDFRSGPVPPGGLYGYEQQQILFPKVQNPLAQPYAAFNQGELLTLTIEALLERYLGGRILNAVSAARRANAEQDTRDEVARALADFLAANSQASPPMPR